MSGARKQPATRRRVRRDLVGRGVGAVFNNTRAEIFGGGTVGLFNNPLQVIAPKHGYARKFVASSSQYARITPPPGIVNLAGHFAVVIAFVIDNTTTGRILHYSDAANNLNFQLVSLLGRLCVVVGTGSNQFADVSSAAVLTPGAPYVAVAGRGPDGFFLHLDGVAQPLGANGGGAIANNIASADIQIGRRGDAASYFSGQITLFAHVKGQVDARSLSLNPWQIFEQESDGDVMFVAHESAPASLIAIEGAQANTGTSGAIAQTQNVAGTSGVQSSTGSAGAIGQEQELSGSDGFQDNNGTVASIGQAQNLVDNDAVQSNAGDTGAIDTSPPGELAGLDASQANVGSDSGIAQALQLAAGVGGTQGNSGAGGALEQLLNLDAVEALQENAGGVGSITVAGPTELAGVPGIQANEGADAAVGQSVQLVGADAEQPNAGSVAQLVRLGLAIIHTDPGELRSYAASGERRVWPDAGEQRTLAIH